MAVGETCSSAAVAPTSCAAGRAATASTCKNGIERPAPGNDRIEARDGGNDEISCGAGNDVAIVDASEDGIYDCEKVKEPAPVAPA